jgi:hypothetical protein
MERIQSVARGAVEPDHQELSGEIREKGYTVLEVPGNPHQDTQYPAGVVQFGEAAWFVDGLMS